MDNQKIISELEQVMQSLEKSADLCKRNLLRQREAMNEIVDAHKRILAVLPQDSTAHRLYDRTTHEGSRVHRQTKSGYAESDDFKKLEDLITLVRAVINELEPEFLRDEHYDKDQFYFTTGDSYRPKKQVFGVMKKQLKT